MSINIPAMQAALLRAKSGFELMLQLGPMATISYSGTGQTRQVRVFEPGQQDVPLTGGQVQEDRLVRVSIDQLAATNPPREIRKGDVLEIRGQKYAIQSAVKAPGVEPYIAWLLQVRG